MRTLTAGDVIQSQHMEVRVQAKPQKEAQTVTAEGKRIGQLIDGVRLHFPETHPDERGDLCEIFNPAWGLRESPPVYAYQVTVRPGKVRGWVVHHEQDDWLFVSFGTLKIVLYDDREASPSRGKLNEICLSEHNRGVVVIPRGVFHAIQNIGEKAAMFINFPTQPYRHENPDKYRLPPNSDVIPYRFESRLGW